MGLNSILLHWAANQSAYVGFIMLGGGIFLLMQGFRFGHLALMLGSAGVGYAAGGIGVATLGAPPEVASIGCSALLGLGAVRNYRFGLGVVSMATCGLALALFCDQLGIGQSGCLTAFAIGAVFGFVLLWIMFGSLTALVTALIGSSAAVLGFVSAASEILPGMGLMFVEATRSFPLLIPVLVGIVTVTGYTYQANNLQGSIITGSVRSESPVALR